LGSFRQFASYSSAGRCNVTATMQAAQEVPVSFDAATKCLPSLVTHNPTHLDSATNLLRKQGAAGGAVPATDTIISTYVSSPTQTAGLHHVSHD